MNRPLVISFDLDGTLLCQGNGHLADPEIPVLMGPFGGREDRLRVGAAPLLRGLVEEGHTLWIYTQSLRGRSEVMGWFEGLGIALEGYVNHSLHERACEERGVVGRRPLKSPHWFGIEVHVDDDVTVEQECRGSGCRVIVIRPDEVDFEGRVRKEIGDLIFEIGG